MGMNTRPEQAITLEVGPPLLPRSISMMALLDTGTDVTVIPVHIWPPEWPTMTQGQLLGVGGAQESRKSTALVKITLAQPTTAADAERVAWCNPMVAAVPTAILGRCCLERWGCRLSTDF